jgi:hypothetical protein
MHVCLPKLSLACMSSSCRTQDLNMDMRIHSFGNMMDHGSTGVAYEASSVIIFCEVPTLAESAGSG